MVSSIDPARDGLARSPRYADDFRVQPGRMPEAFSSELLSPERAPPWRMIVHGLETDAFRMRQRLQHSLALSHGRHRAWLNHLLLACYSGRYGYRSGGPHREDFEVWAISIGAVVEMAPLTSSTDTVGPQPIAAGVTGLSFPRSGDHEPPGHDYLLFRLAALCPPLCNAVFAQETRPSGHRLLAWIAGESYEASAQLDGPRYDVAAVLGFLNSILRGMGQAERFAETKGGAICGAPQRLVQIPRD